MKSNWSKSYGKYSASYGLNIHITISFEPFSWILEFIKTSTKITEFLYYKIAYQLTLNTFIL